MRLPISPDLTDAVRRQLATFLSHPPEKLAWHVPTAERAGALPLYIGWLTTIGLRPDGSLVEWNTDDPDMNLRDPDETWGTVALVEGVRKYPELRPLLPVRPDTASECNQCGGTGWLVPVSDPEGFICEPCRGLGWTLHRDA
jgi:hypothetical protein